MDQSPEPINVVVEQPTEKKFRSGWSVAGIFALVVIGVIAVIACGAISFYFYNEAQAESALPPVPPIVQSDAKPVVVDPPVSAPVEVAPVVQAPVVSNPVAIDPPAQIPNTQGSVQTESTEPLSVVLIPVGGVVDLSNTIAKPQGFPDNWKEMTSKAQAEWVASVVNGPVEAVLGEPGVAFSFNGKGVVTHSFTCPLGFTCHQHLVDGDRTVFYRGHGETAEVYATTFRIEALIPGGGGLCQNWHDALVYETSIGNLVAGLGEVSQCPPLPQSRLADINTDLGKRLAEVIRMSGVQLISIGTVEKGFGAFWVYTNNLGTQNITCPANFTCLYTLDGTTWTWVDGEAKIENAQGAILFDKAYVSDPQAVAAVLTK